MAKIANVQEVAPGALKFYSGNAKIHSEDQVDRIIQSIREFRFLTPCLIDRENNIIAGHGRIMAAKKMGMETVPCVLVEGLTDAQRRAYIMADNRLAELATWDMDLVAQELEALRLEGFDFSVVGFDPEDIVEGLDDITEDSFTFEEDPDEEPEARTGQIWRLGDHFLMCGDSTDPEQVAQLVQGEEIDLLLTDPPYNVDYTGGTEDALKIANDSMEETAFFDLLQKAFMNAEAVMKPGAGFYIWHASQTQDVFMAAIKSTRDLEIHQQLIWVKDHVILGRADYLWTHEPCFYGWKNGAAHYFVNSRKETTVYEDVGVRLSTLKKQELVELCEKLMGLSQESTVARFAKPLTSAEHPTMKPVELVAWQMRNSTTRGQSVLDLFGGGGSTLIAAEQLGRRCYMMELDPHYADVIIKRWEVFTGKEAQLRNGDDTEDD